MVQIEMPTPCAVYKVNAGSMYARGQVPSHVPEFVRVEESHFFVLFFIYIIVSDNGIIVSLELNSKRR